MKTSTILITLGIVTSFATLTVTNLQLKKDYDRNQLKDPFVKRAIPSFHYIRNYADSNVLHRGNFQVLIGTSDTAGIATYYAEQEQFHFNVSNDTLNITANPEFKEVFGSRTPVFIYVKDLRGLKTINGEYELKGKDIDSLSIVAEKNADIRLNAEKARAIDALAIHNGEISLSVKDAVGSLHVKLEDESGLYANNVAADRKNIQVSERASIRLKGRSIDNFGLKKTQ